MMRTNGLAAASASLLTATSLIASPSSAQSKTQGKTFLDVVVYSYVPSAGLPANPPIVVDLHPCQSSATAYDNEMMTLANAHKFIVLYPDAPAADINKCWDVYSADKSLMRDGGGDSNGIVLGVKDAITTYAADASRVFAVGASTGGMMVNVLLALYPDVFAKGVVLSGVPYACFAGTSFWNSGCATPTAQNGYVRTGQAWGDLVRSAFAFTGTRPPVSLLHGGSDEILNVQLLEEQIKQWTNVLGVSETPTATLTDTPKTGFTRRLYQDASGNVRVQAAVQLSGLHNLTDDGLNGDVLRFFCLDGDPCTAPTDGGVDGAALQVPDGGGEGGSDPSGDGAWDSASDAGGVLDASVVDGSADAGARVEGAIDGTASDGSASDGSASDGADATLVTTDVSVADAVSDDAKGSGGKGGRDGSTGAAGGAGTAAVDGSTGTAGTAGSSLQRIASDGCGCELHPQGSRLRGLAGLMVLGCGAWLRRARRRRA